MEASNSTGIGIPETTNSTGVGIPETTNSTGVGIPETTLDFSFGFDDDNYSDRTLLLEIVDDNTPTEPRVKTIRINSLILAARSQFFCKLFSNGMRESGQKVATLRIETLEEVSFMDLLKYVYSNNLPTTLYALLHLLVIADKFEVASCSRDCTRLLQNMPMTCESASLYLELPPSLQPLIDDAKQFLVAHFKDFDQCKEELLNLSLLGVQVVLSSDDLQVTSEGVVYDSVLTWARKHYPDLEERRGILKARLLDLVRFPFMTTTQLTEKVQTCSDIDPELASQIVIRAVCFKAETLHRKHCLAAEQCNAMSRQFMERAYKYRPIKVVELESPHQHCIVYFDLPRKDLELIFPDGEIMSQTFHLGKQELALICRCIFNKQYNCHFLSLAIKVVGLTARFTFDYELAVRMKLTEEFKIWYFSSHTFTEPGSIVRVDDTIWTDITGEESAALINDILHMRVSLTSHHQDMSCPK